MDMSNLTEAVKKILALLPECRCEADALLPGLEYFWVEKNELVKAAEELPRNHDLEYEGVRRLLSLCLEEFASIFTESGSKHCEVTVPSPVCAMYAMQAAAKDTDFISSAFFAQIALRGIFLHREPVDLQSCARRRCGLNKMRFMLLSQPPVKAPEYQIEFGVLCDECVKVGESLGQATVTISGSFPKGRDKYSGQRRLAEDFCRRIYEATGISPENTHINRAFCLYGRLMKALNTIAALNLRRDRLPLSGNSLALAQSVSLMCTPRAEEFIAALEILAGELERAPLAHIEKRFYCFYVPFLQPEVDRRFRENGVHLVGNAAFLTRSRAVGFDVPGMILAWLESMALRADTAQLCEIIAAGMEKAGCDTYITGAFAFDRWLGSTVPMQAKLLSAHGIRTRSIEADFWCENVMFGSVLNRIDQLCMK